jgi:hypothetical protein
LKHFRIGHNACKGVGFSLEVVSKSQIVFQGKAQADEKAQHTR